MIILDIKIIILFVVLFYLLENKIKYYFFTFLYTKGIIPIIIP